MILKGKCSHFGGANDPGMMPRPGMPDGDSGLALYEPNEANCRPEIFFEAPVAEPFQATWKRLRTYFPYLAMRFDKSISRKVLQNTPFKITNPSSGKWIIGFLVDYGPHEDTGRIIDCSPIILERLGLKTDDEVEVEKLI